MKSLYEEFLPKTGYVLDLAASWDSHLPDGNYRVCGLGLNKVELDANPLLTEKIIHDLNKNPSLPFNSNTFDIVICSLSVDYFTKPYQLFKEINRILKNDGVFTVSFSNRWFPEKVVKIWTELHDFERIGLVLDYFIETGYKELITVSVRGFERPLDDKYRHITKFSDPIFVVLGKKSDVN